MRKQLISECGTVKLLGKLYLNQSSQVLKADIAHDDGNKCIWQVLAQQVLQ